ncbi:MAPEG family protein [Yoonia litorea]|uniref:MAPEG family protein n=1 Tax=Yoonia litorea TaxID=1123755 RepID=A0A1I6LHQ9_9RHOB|nr:MAPEG family protein [Yoonia litorea]SFS02860.1 hypothetical protein SAMN05444714_0546 [Yoonia litorea]
MSLPITSLSAIFAAALITVLTVQVIRLRRKDGVVLGDNGDRVLAKAIRGHANATEQLPIALILMGLAEVQGAPPALLWLSAAALIAGRTMHATYFGIHGMHWKLRFYGMWLTFAAQVLLILSLLIALLS